MTTTYFPKVLGLNLIITIIHACLVEFLSHKQSCGWKNIFTKHHLILLLFGKAWNLIPTSYQRNNILKLRIKKQSKKGNSVTLNYSKSNQIINMFSYINHKYIFICTFAVNHIICIFIGTWYTFHFCLWHLYSTSNYPVKSVKVLRVSLPEPVILFTYIPLLIWSFAFTKKFDNEVTFTLKINLMLSAISIMAILAKLFQMIWGHVYSFLVCSSFSVRIFEIYAFHITMLILGEDT